MLVLLLQRSCGNAAAYQLTNSTKRSVILYLLGTCLRAETNPCWKSKMRIDYLRIKRFKNLRDTSIDFDETELSTVLIGENGTGKSNVIEALATIFRDL